jgi:hypothetical protein
MAVISKVWGALRDGAQGILKKLYSKTELIAILKSVKDRSFNFVLFRWIYKNLYHY